MSGSHWSHIMALASVSYRRRMRYPATLGLNRLNAVSVCIIKTHYMMGRALPPSTRAFKWASLRQADDSLTRRTIVP